MLVVIVAKTLAAGAKHSSALIVWPIVSLCHSLIYHRRPLWAQAEAERAKAERAREAKRAN